MDHTYNTSDGLYQVHVRRNVNMTSLFTLVQLPAQDVNRVSFIMKRILKLHTAFMQTRRFVFDNNSVFKG